MTQNVFPDTVTSIKENIATLACASSSEGEETKPVSGKIIDMPGHPALSGFVRLASVTHRQVVKYIPQAAGIVYLIDGTEYNVSSIAEY